ncbi:RNA-directed DNA polymerase [Abeliophyllum distichum]|uniref:RNA-directed DNA polymerase n=1 Tax=Abeliophyllum distichum TaxID=126358 RepID=A0ABD1TJ38_9LAMI
MEFKDECDNGVVESKDQCDSEVLPEMKDDGVKYPVDGESLIARPTLQEQIKIETFDQQFKLDVQETTREEEIQQMVLLVHKKSHFILRKINNSLPSFTISLLQELEDESSKKMSSKLPPIRDIAHQFHFVLGAVSPKRSTNRSNPDETNELPIHQIKANKGCRFIFDSGDWIWIHVKGLYPFYASSDSKLNPFEEGEDDAIQVSHEPLLH